MTITFGRVGVDIALGDPHTWDRDGTRVLVAGLASASTTAEATTLSEQLLGLVNPHEPYIAVTWSYEPWADGYYRVIAVSVPGTPESGSPFTDFPYTIELDRIADSASPTIDTSLLGALRVNGNGVVIGDAHVWGPEAMTGGYTFGGAPFGADGILYSGTTPGTTRATETGDLIRGGIGSTAQVGNGYAAFDVPPGDYYDGTCLIRSGATLRRVTGARMKLLPTNWELGNGLIRVTPGALSTLIVEVWNGAAWEDAKTFHFTSGAATGTNAFVNSVGWGDVSILRNSPEACALRLVPGYGGTGTQSKSVVDLHIQRGRFTCSVTYNVNGLAAGTTVGSVGFGRATAEAATALTGGIRATANDAAGNRYVLALASATTNDLVQGNVRLTAAVAPPIQFMFGLELNGSGASTPSGAAAILAEWYYPIEERMAPRTR